VPFLWEMLYQAIHVAEGQPAPPRSVLDDPPIAHYLTEFGSREGDDAVVACDDAIPVGAAFCRRFGADDRSYGWVSADVPEVGMAVVPASRGKGIGRAMLTALLERHPTMSLSVDVDNVGARALYESLGFAVVRPDGTSVTMLRRP
jgi:ribosomal protein S18 acetylase RimI-like enzyme